MEPRWTMRNEISFGRNQDRTIDKRRGKTYQRNSRKKLSRLRRYSGAVRIRAGQCTHSHEEQNIPSHYGRSQTSRKHTCFRNMANERLSYRRNTQWLQKQQIK